MTHDGTLIINEVSAEDAGVYECTAVGEYRTTRSRIELIIRGMLSSFVQLFVACRGVVILEHRISNSMFLSRSKLDVNRKLESILREFIKEISTLLRCVLCIYKLLTLCKKLKWHINRSLKLIIYIENYDSQASN